MVTCWQPHSTENRGQNVISNWGHSTSDLIALWRDRKSIELLWFGGPRSANCFLTRNFHHQKQAAVSWETVPVKQILLGEKAACFRIPWEKGDKKQGPDWLLGLGTPTTLQSKIQPENKDFYLIAKLQRTMQNNYRQSLRKLLSSRLFF